MNERILTAENWVIDGILTLVVRVDMRDKRIITQQEINYSIKWGEKFLKKWNSHELRKEKPSDIKVLLVDNNNRLGD